MNEFELIQRYFTNGFPQHPDVLLGIGDDAALCHIPTGETLAISVDTLVAGVHFPLQTAPEDIGYKALAVNLSDMAAMGAHPCWFTLALTCPVADETWLAAFSRGMAELAQNAGVSLIGGDTTRGALTVSVQMMGYVPFAGALRRAGARVGDGIFVSGTLGDAGLGLASVQEKIILPPAIKIFVEQRLNRPSPRHALGLLLRGVASSAIDISDGLLADLTHILTASQVGARLYLAQLPLSTALRNGVDMETAHRFALTAGDDYELCFTVPPARQAILEPLLAAEICTQIGVIEAGEGICGVDKNGAEIILQGIGYRHF